MSRLNGQDRRALQEALLSAFPTYKDLELMIGLQLDGNLGQIVESGPLNQVVYRLIKKAEAGGWVAELLASARRANPGNPDLKAFEKSFIAQAKAGNPDPKASAKVAIPQAGPGARTARQPDPLGPVLMLVFNLVVVGSLAFVINGWGQISALFPCISPWIVSVSVATYALLLIHSAVRLIGDLGPVEGELKIGPVVMRTESLARIAALMHPAWLPKRALLVILVVFTALCAWFLSPLTPVPAPAAPVPVASAFVVSYPSGATARLSLAETLVMRVGEPGPLIELEFLNQASAECAWASVNGTLQPAGGFAYHYTPPPDPGSDNITIALSAPCSSFSQQIVLPVEITP